MRSLSCWIGARQHRPRLAQAESQLAEQALALPYSELDAIGFVDPRRQRLAIPQIDPHSGVTRFLSQYSIDFLPLLFAETRRSTGALPFGQPTQSLLLESMDPILHRTWSITEQARHIRAGHALRHQQHAMLWLSPELTHVAVK